MLFKRWIFSLILVTHAVSLQAVELSVGEVYEAGSTVQSSEAGLSLTIPSGWLGAMPQGVNAFVIQRQGAQDTILVQAERMDKQSVLALMNQPITLDQGLILTPLSKATEKSGVISGKYSVSGQYAHARGEIRSVVGEYGVSVALIGLGFSEGEPGKTLDSLVGTVKFQAPVETRKKAGESSAGGGKSWADYMRGRYIVYYYTGSGYHEEDHIWLCSDGSFYRSNSSGGFGGGASGAFGGKGSGQWSATGVLPGEGVLTLTSGPGVFEGNTTFGDWKEQRGASQASFRLSLQNNKLYLNGDQWLRDSNKRCQ